MSFPSHWRAEEEAAVDKKPHDISCTWIPSVIKIRMPVPCAVPITP